MDKESAINYLYNLTNKGIKYDLSRIEKILDLIGNPHNKLKTIHVAGTKGKGSVSTFIYQCLREEGYRVGIYTSPHLMSFNERIIINDELISDDELIKLVEFIKQKIDNTSVNPTFFEFTTALAFLYFFEKKVDILVVEVGLGGRFDATNVITPIVSVITSMGIDHSEFLGDTISKIASEKAGIIKNNIPIISSENSDEVINIFSEISKIKNSNFFHVGKELNYEKINDKIFRTYGLINDEFEISLDGDFQIKNAATAILSLVVLGNNSNFKISQQSIKSGLKKSFISGRLERIDNILIDGAHNPQAISEVIKYLDKFNKKFIIIFGAKEGKNIDEMISLLVPYADKFIFTLSSFKPASFDMLEKALNSDRIDFFKIQNPKDAFDFAKKIADKNDIILVIGSLYLAGDILKLIKNANNSVINIQY